MGKKRKRQYTLEFKQQAVKLANKIGVSRAAKQLGVPMGNVHRWREKEGIRNTKPEALDINLKDENRKLKKENDELKKVNLILKKAAAFLSQDHLK